MLPGLVGSIQAIETVKLIIGAGESLAGRLLLIDALDMEFRSVKLRRNPACPLCGDNPTVTELIDYEGLLRRTRRRRMKRQCHSEESLGGRTTKNLGRTSATENPAMVTAVALDPSTSLRVTLLC